MIAQTPSALSLPLRTPHFAARVPAVPPPGDTAPRFTVDGGAELERHLAQTCGKIAAGIRGLIPHHKLEAILLGGGYGRGEGGVWVTPAGARPYNDLEFYVCLRGNRHLSERRFGRALHVLGEILTPQAGVEVEFKITSLRELAHRPVSMFSYDLVMGHRWLLGDDALLTYCAHHRDAQAIPLAEATRLLMNRCSGLLFAQERLHRREFTAADADFVRRNLAKAELALGDAVLVAHGQYHWQVRERHRRLEHLARSDSLPWIDDVLRRHATGVEFKLHPERSVASRAELAALHAPVTALAQNIWLWIEQRRIGAPFASIHDYVQSSLNKCRDCPPARNVLVNLRLLGLRPWWEGRARRHPRERIFNAMSLLLWDRTALGALAPLRQIQRELQIQAATLPEIMRAYRELWSQVN